MQPTKGLHKQPAIFLRITTGLYFLPFVNLLNFTGFRKAG